MRPVARAAVYVQSGTEAAARTTRPPINELATVPAETVFCPIDSDIAVEEVPQPKMLYPLVCIHI